MQKEREIKKGWTSNPLQQASGDTIWELTRNNNGFLISNQGHTFSRDPLNLTGLNTKRDSGLANTHALGIGHEAVQSQWRTKDAKVKGKKIRFSLRIKTKRLIPRRRLVALKADQLPLHNNTVYSERRRLAYRPIVKALQRDLQNYRRDLVPLALRRVAALQKFKRRNLTVPKPKKQ